MGKMRMCCYSVMEVSISTFWLVVQAGLRRRLRRESFSGTKDWKFEVGWNQLRSSIIAGLLAELSRLTRVMIAKSEPYFGRK